MEYGLENLNNSQYLITNIRNQLEKRYNPNPTTGTLNIEFGKIGNYSLFSIDGKQVLKKGRLQNNIRNINISGLNTGMYLLRMMMEILLLKW